MMINWFKQIKESWQIEKANKKNFTEFKNEIQHEMDTPNSVFNNYDLAFSPDNTRITMVLTLPENYAQYPSEPLIDMKIREITNPVTYHYIYDLNWQEYLAQPTIFHLEDENTEGIKEGKEMSLTYLAIWKWTPVDVPMHKWKQKLSVAVGSTVAALGAIITTLICLL